MDPDACLTQMRDAIREARQPILDQSADDFAVITDRLDTLADLAEALDQWMARGGMPPAAWLDHPCDPPPAGRIEAGQ